MTHNGSHSHQSYGIHQTRNRTFSIMVDNLTHLWNLCIFFLNQDIAMHANNVKSYFHQLKHRPDVIGAFSVIIGELLFLQCELTCSSNFSQAGWEPIRCIAEQLATVLFHDNSLQEKHKHYLEKLIQDNSLQNCKKQHFMPGLRDSRNTGVLHQDRSMKPTPHHLFVDYNVYRYKATTISYNNHYSQHQGYLSPSGESNLSKQQDHKGREGCIT